MDSKQNMKTEYISLKEIMCTLWQLKIVIIVPVILSLLVAISYIYFTPTKYSSSVDVYALSPVRINKGLISDNDFRKVAYSTDSYKYISDALKSNIDMSNLSFSIKCPGINAKERVVTLTVRDENPERAERIVKLWSNFVVGEFEKLTSNAFTKKFAPIAEKREILRKRLEKVECAIADAEIKAGLDVLEKKKATLDAKHMALVYLLAEEELTTEELLLNGKNSSMLPHRRRIALIKKKIETVQKKQENVDKGIKRIDRKLETLRDERRAVLSCIGRQNDYYKDADMISFVVDDPVKIMTNTEVKAKPIAKNVNAVIILSLIIGFILGIALALIKGFIVDGDKNFEGIFISFDR